MLVGKETAVAEIINLRRARKNRARTRAETEAQANRARFGRTRAERTRDEAEAARLDRTVDGARLTASELEPRGDADESTP